MDQYLVAMGFVVAFAAFFFLYVIFSDRKGRKAYEPTEHGDYPL